MMEFQATASRQPAWPGTRAREPRRFTTRSASRTCPMKAAAPTRFSSSSIARSRATVVGFEAHEHTAQVSYEDRQQREQDFGCGKLPVLYCSPTMELGVDIRQLNVVNMRNVPPTPANYAQRSGRAGRSGQPALVLTYCAAGNSHDQYFFRRQELMVSGAVSLPRLDLANEDLVRAHVHALWLAETEQYLGDSLTEILDVEGVSPSLDLKAGPKSSLTKKSALVAARDKTQTILDTLERGARTIVLVQTRLARASLEPDHAELRGCLRALAKPFPGGQGPVELSEPGHRRRRPSAPVGGSQAAAA